MGIVFQIKALTALLMLGVVSLYEIRLTCMSDMHIQDIVICHMVSQCHDQMPIRDKHIHKG